ncbi:MAG TPA: hypothetical protein VND70_03060 [Acidimicrobiales bacterium]|nr:hypothetical protein [Acidimicrobiales bacterium]
MVGLLALGALGFGVVQAAHAESRLTSPVAVRADAQSDAYYACLDAQAHSLVGPHDVVYLGEATLDRWVTVIKAVGGWADMTVHRSRATVAIVLVHATGGPSCAGDVFLSIRRRAGGQVLMARGRPRSR